MRFVAMRLRNIKGKKYPSLDKTNEDDDDANDEEETWKPTLQGFLKYLVDSHLVFDTIERTVDESEHVACK